MNEPSRAADRRHTSFLVYPFRTIPRRKVRGGSATPAAKHWRHVWHRIDEKALPSHIDGSFFFLPYIRDLLFPDAEEWAAEKHGEQLRQRPVAKLLSKTPQDVLLRLTFDPAQLARHNPFRLLVPGGESLPFRIDWIDLCLFPLDIGFLVLKVSAEEPAITADAVNELLYQLGMVFPPRMGMPLARWKSADDIELEGRHWVEFLLQGFTAFRAPAFDDLADFARAIQSLPAASQYTLGADGQTHGDRFRLFTFLALPQSELEGGVAEPLPSSWDRVLYELATLTMLSDPAFRPSSSVIEEFSREIISRWQNWRAAALPEHVVFSARSDAFTLDVLAHNVESDYLNLYLLSLFLKTRLSFFFADLIQRNPSLLRNLFAARRISKAFIRFQNEFWFPEVTHKPQGAYLYGRFQAVHRNDTVYSELNMQIQNLVSHLEQRYQFVIAILVALFVGPKTVGEFVEAMPRLTRFLWEIVERFR